MDVPRGARPRIKRHTRATHARRIGPFKQRLDLDAPGKPISWSFRRLSRTISLNFHSLLSTLDYHLSTFSDGHCAVNPPSTIRLCPVTKDDLPEHNQRTASATSS